MDDQSKQVEELEALSAIYGDEFQAEDEENRAYSINIQDGENYVKLYMKLPLDYPSSSSPIYELSAPHFSHSKKVYISGLLKELHLSHKGQPVLFQWIEKIREELQSGAEIAQEDSEEPECENAEKSEESDCECPEIMHGEVISDRKSTFQGHVAVVISAKQVPLVLTRLLENKKIAHATHNMYAYRIYSESTNSFVHDCEDDGEAQAGGRLLHLLQIIGVKNILVVVSRWYGGVHLGPDRFRHISNAARQVLVAANLMPDNKLPHK